MPLLDSGEIHRRVAALDNRPHRRLAASDASEAKWAEAYGLATLTAKADRSLKATAILKAKNIKNTTPPDSTRHFVLLFLKIPKNQCISL